MIVLENDSILIIIAILQGRYSCKTAKEPPHIPNGGSVLLDGESADEAEAQL